MTPQEVREEMRMLEGDPAGDRGGLVQRPVGAPPSVRGRAEGDVVVTNPTELAVAIVRFEDDGGPDRRRQGSGLIAQQIRRWRLENGIPLVEKKPLAQALYREVEVGRPIPHQQHAAVAEVLATSINSSAAAANHGLSAEAARGSNPRFKVQFPMAKVSKTGPLTGSTRFYLNLGPWTLDLEP